jgi:benzoate/toluate 1,2-dioxygenase reductase subunit
MGKETVSKPPNNPAAIQTIELQKRRWLSKKAFEINLTRPAPFEFKAGQTIRFIHRSIKRYYSIVSTPDDPNLVLYVHHVPKGLFSQILAEVEIGARFNVTGPHGYFTFRPSARQAVFVATGTGIAPFVSMGRSGVTDFILLHEVEFAEDLYYHNLFRKISFNYVPCLLKPIAGEIQPPGTFHGKAADFIREKLQPASYDFYLCGGREMTREVTLLADDRFSGSYVFKEVFF